MASQYDISAVQGQVRYSGRRGKPSSNLSPRTDAGKPTSPVWSFAAVTLVFAMFQHSIPISVGFVIAQLAVMTAVQSLVMYAHRNVFKLGLNPFRLLPALRVIRFASFALALLAIGFTA